MRMTRFGVYNAVLPPEGPVSFPVSLDFSKASEYTINMADEIDGGKTTYISGFYLDNIGNPNPVIATLAGTGQRIRIPADKCAWMPALFTDSAEITFASAMSPGGVGVKAFLVNFPVWPHVF